MRIHGLPARLNGGKAAVQSSMKATMEQLYSPNILRLWSSGACASFYETKEDDEALIVVLVDFTNAPLFF